MRFYRRRGEVTMDRTHFFHGIPVRIRRVQVGGYVSEMSFLSGAVGSNGQAELICPRYQYPTLVTYRVSVCGRLMDSHLHYPTALASAERIARAIFAKANPKR